MADAIFEGFSRAGTIFEGFSRGPRIRGPCMNPVVRVAYIDLYIEVSRYLLSLKNSKHKRDNGQINPIKRVGRGGHYFQMAV